MGLQLGKWLGRLGYKTGVMPVVNLDRVQPGIVLGNHSHLLPPSVQCSYLVGGTFTAGAAVFSTLLVHSPVPLRIQEVVTGSPSATNTRFLIGNAGALPALANAVALVPQHQRLGGPAAAATWRMGDVAAALAATLPAIGSTTQSALSTSSPFIVPAGGFLQVTQSTAQLEFRMYLNVDELPTELPE